MKQNGHNSETKARGHKFFAGFSYFVEVYLLPKDGV
jgi:hypothetical protein